MRFEDDDDHVDKLNMPITGLPGVNNSINDNSNSRINNSSDSSSNSSSSSGSNNSSNSSSDSYSSSSSGSNDIGVNSGSVIDSGSSNAIAPFIQNGARESSPVDLVNIDDALHGDIVIDFVKEGEQVPNIRDLDINFEQRESSDIPLGPESMDVVEDGNTSDGSSNIMMTGDFEGHEETICDCCRDGTVYDDDALVYCDSCDVCVHQSCYDVSDAALKQDTWYCDPCAAHADTENLSCALCPLKGGAYRRLSDEKSKIKSVHVLCCNYVPGCYIEKKKIKRGIYQHRLFYLRLYQCSLINLYICSSLHFIHFLRRSWFRNRYCSEYK